MFAGETSLCTTPAPWRYASARARSAPIAATAGAASAPDRTRSRTSVPFTYSSTRTPRPSAAEIASNSVTSEGCDRVARMRTSSCCRRRSAADANSGRKILSATSLPSASSVAR